MDLYGMEKKKSNNKRQWKKVSKRHEILLIIIKLSKCAVFVYFSNMGECQNVGIPDKCPAKYIKEYLNS